jgi:NAD-dependent dihydropyrimidine dehydrogenase PreA subunit
MTQTFMGLSREKIPWAPVIDYARCDFCMECDEFCPHRVFERRDEEPVLVVSNPNNCVVFCRACAKLCGPDALSFPDRPETIALIKQLRQADEGAADAAEDGHAAVVGGERDA